MAQAFLIKRGTIENITEVKSGLLATNSGSTGIIYNTLSFSGLAFNTEEPSLNYGSFASEQQEE